MASYRVDITQQARHEIRDLPGNMRQRVIRLLRDLETQPRPTHSKQLDVNQLQVELPSSVEPRRLRIERWRIIYTIEEEISQVTVLAVRKRPPYQYEDLESLLSDS